MTRALLHRARAISVLAAALTLCPSTVTTQYVPGREDVRTPAGNVVAQPVPILDRHNDTLTQIRQTVSGEERTFLTRSDRGHIDLPRAREGGLAGGFFAIFTNWVRVLTETWTE